MKPNKFRELEERERIRTSEQALCYVETWLLPKVCLYVRLRHKNFFVPKLRSDFCSLAFLKQMECDKVVRIKMHPASKRFY